MMVCGEWYLWHGRSGMAGMEYGGLGMLRACSVGTVPFRSPIQMVSFLQFQNGKNPLFTMETVAERNGTVPTEQALILSRVPTPEYYEQLEALC